METICISFGGSVISRETGLNIQYIKEFAKILARHKEKKFIAITGGGAVNRGYISKLRDEGMSEFELDEIGIAFTRINAMALMSFLNGSDVYPKVVTNVDELKRAHHQSRIVLLGGYIPGISTDAVSVITSEAVHARRLINISREAYVYDRPPEEKGARKLSTLDYDGLIALAAKYDSRTAKSGFIFDIVASKLAKRSKLRIDFVGESIEELEKAIKGMKHEGTAIGK